MGEHAPTRPVGRLVELLGRHVPERRRVLERREVVLRRRGDRDLLGGQRAVGEQVELVRLAVGEVDLVDLLRGLHRLTVDLLDQVALLDLVAPLLAAQVVRDVHAAGLEVLLLGDVEPLAGRRRRLAREQCKEPRKGENTGECLHGNAPRNADGAGL
jgi:hypothetical protein